MIGQKENEQGKCYCSRCGKWLRSIKFYTYRDSSKCEMCKQCLTAHIDNFNPDTYLWILQKMDVPYVPPEWNSIRDKAFAKDPRKMNGMSVIGKYLAKMKLNQWNKYSYKDTEQIQKELAEKEQKKEEEKKKERALYEAQLKTKLSEGKITLAQYQTLVSTETQKEELQQTGPWGNAITGQQSVVKSIPPSDSAYGQALNPFQEQNFLPESSIVDPGANLSDQDKMYLAVKWGRLYRPSQWVALQQLYNEFMNSFDIQGAARIDTLKMICKTSLKMNEAIDCGDIDSYKKLSTVYDSMMKSAKFTEAQNKAGDSDAIDSVSALVDFVEAHSGAIPKYVCDEPQDIVDQIILDLKTYNRNLIYEDKSLAQQIEQYLKDKKIAEEVKNDRKEAKKQGLSALELDDSEIIKHKEHLKAMKQHDQQLDDEKIEQEYKRRRVAQE